MAKAKLKFCAVDWCVAAVRLSSTFCPIHQRFSEHYVPDSEPEPCETCEGSRQCENCKGTGECDECHCGHAHDCGVCDGDGHCQDCESQYTGPRLNDLERAYVEWALSDGIAPCEPFFTGVRES